jgi:gas vesicle protein
MKTALKFLLASGSIAILTACATQTGTATVEGAALGAGGGYLACKLLGGSDSKCLAAAAVGATIGAVVSYSFATDLQKRKKELAGKENDLDARIRYVRGLNQDGQKLNEKLRTTVAEADNRTTVLLQQLKSKNSSAVQLASARERLSKEIDAAQEQAQLQRKAYEEVRLYRSGLKQKSSPLDTEIASQEQIVAETQLHVNELLRLRERVPT